MDKKGQIRFLYIISFLVAACSILYELIIAQAISFMAASTVKRYSVTIGLYLVSMGLAAFFCNKIFKKQNQWFSLIKIEGLLTLCGSLAVVGVYFAHAFYRFLEFQGFFGSTASFFLLVSFVIIIIGFLTGLELPLLIKAANGLSKKKITNRILGLDYFGSLAGAVAFPLWLHANFELITISFLTALLNAFIALSIFLIFRKTFRNSFLKKALVALIFFLPIIGLVNTGWLQQYFLKKYYYHYRSSESIKNLFSPMNNLPKIKRFSSRYQKIDLVKALGYNDSYSEILIDAYKKKADKIPEHFRSYILCINGNYQFWTDYEKIYHEYFIHVPIIVEGRVPENVLVLGGGDGLPARELVKYLQVKKITIVDIDKKMIQLAKNHPILSTINEHSLDDSRVKIIIDDAYNYIKNCKIKYDAIYIDFPDPTDYNLAKLYSSEFYYFVKKHLKKDGYIAIDSPGNEERESSWRIYANTLKKAGFSGILPYASNLEENNSKAISKLKNADITFSHPKLGEYKPKGKQKESVVKQLIKVFAEDLQKGFIMAKKNKGSLEIKYKKPDISLFILDKKRFKLAFSFPYRISEKVDQKKVNSIMRPKFPDFPFWFIKKPY